MLSDEASSFFEHIWRTKTFAEGDKVSAKVISGALALHRDVSVHHLLRW